MVTLLMALGFHAAIASPRTTPSLQGTVGCPVASECQITQGQLGFDRTGHTTEHSEDCELMSHVEQGQVNIGQLQEGNTESPHHLQACWLWPQCLPFIPFSPGTW